ncbi:MAG: DUF2252 family protein [Bacteroidetes bacterium]|nr:DUF2252 family protein [Bacteroidota bacterium]
MPTLEERLKKFNSNRVPEMVQRKYQAMAQNMFRFYRGTCHLFYEDLHKIKGFPKSPPAWICGDLHLENFGSYKSDNRLVYFDLNDFDEAILAPALWEVVRLTTSIILAFEILKIDKQKAAKMAQLFVKSYAATLAAGKAYYIERKTAKGIIQTFLTAVGKRKAKSLLDRRAIIKKHISRIKIDNKKHFEIDSILKRELTLLMEHWLYHNHDGPFNYRVADVAFRLAGTGSVGVKRYIFLLESTRREQDYLLVDMKQSMESSLKPFVKFTQPDWQSHAERVVSVQRRMQNIPPALLSIVEFRGESYLIQELQYEKDSIDFNLIRDRYRDIYKVIDDMAILTASSQLRSSGRQGSAIADALIAFGSDNSWQEEVLRYSREYATKTKIYFREFKRLYKQGVFST